VFRSETPKEVLARFFLGAEHHSTEIDSALMLASRRDSLRSAVEGLVAAGPPQER
jgi:hypothetical protein